MQIVNTTVLVIVSYTPPRVTYRRLLEQSNECASGLEHAFKSSVHFFFFDKLAALRCRNSFFNRFKELGFLVEIADNKICHQSLRVGPSFGGDLRKLRLLLRSEMYFHSPPR